MGYIILIYFCHRGEDRILGTPSARDSVVGPLVKRTRMARYSIVAIACIVTVGVLALIGVQIERKQFYIDCKSEPAVVVTH
jgi:hypothetical protein